MAYRLVLIPLVVALLLLSSGITYGAEIEAVHLVTVRGTQYEVTKVEAIKSPTWCGIPVGKKYYVYQTLGGYPLRLSAAEHKEAKAQLKGVLDPRSFDEAHPYADKGLRVANLVFSIVTAVR